MAFTMHSHSGEFCPGHAKDQLEDIVRHAVSIGMKTIGLTEHMPRLAVQDLYPEELEPSPEENLALLGPMHQAYIEEAYRLQKKYALQIHILVGFEGEWYGAGREADYAAEIKRLVSVDPGVDYFIGSIHHVHAVPIDYSKELYRKAVRTANQLRRAGGGGSSTEGITEIPATRDDDDDDDSEQQLYADYYDAQHAMLLALHPRVVGHFDLVRLMSADPARDVAARWPAVWRRIERNLRLVVDQGGWLECNASGLRKGLAEPYPARPIAAAYLAMGGRFTVSDDSHGIAQVATHYGPALEYLDHLGVREVWTLERVAGDGDGDGDGSGGRRRLLEKSVALEEFKKCLR